VYGRDDYGTFSIVACDPERRFWGVAVATKPTCVGAVVPWAQWPDGALATQADTNYHYGPQGLGLLGRGMPAEEVVRRLTRADPGRARRQLGVVDRRGRSAAWTGEKCGEWAGHETGENYACQGNLLAGDRVVPSMVRAFERSRGTLAGRLLAALVAGHRAGGDRRGIASAALLVVRREPWFDRAWSDLWVDIRVDLHARPIAELGRILRSEESATRREIARHKRPAKRSVSRPSRTRE
jgi:uncharacterized Ntn-hydrolase superfamily protein